MSILTHLERIWLCFDWYLKKNIFNFICLRLMCESLFWRKTKEDRRQKHKGLSYPKSSNTDAQSRLSSSNKAHQVPLSICMRASGSQLAPVLAPLFTTDSPEVAQSNKVPWGVEGQTYDLYTTTFTLKTEKTEVPSIFKTLEPDQKYHCFTTLTSY